MCNTTQALKKGSLVVWATVPVEYENKIYYHHAIVHVALAKDATWRGSGLKEIQRNMH